MREVSKKLLFICFLLSMHNFYIPQSYLPLVIISSLNYIAPNIVPGLIQGDAAEV